MRSVHRLPRRDELEDEEEEEEEERRRITSSCGTLCLHYEIHLAPQSPIDGSLAVPCAVQGPRLRAQSGVPSFSECVADATSCSLALGAELLAPKPVARDCSHSLAAASCKIPPNPSRSHSIFFKERITQTRLAPPRIMEPAVGHAGVVILRGVVGACCDTLAACDGGVGRALQQQALLLPGSTVIVGRLPGSNICLPQA